MSNSRRQETPMTYNPETGKWESKPNPPASQTTGSTDSGNTTNSGSAPDTSTPAPSTTTPTQVDSTKQAEKEFIETEFNTLVGEVSLVPSKKSIKIKVNDTVTISGVGSYLSGNYFVSAIKRSISRDSGYTHSISVIKNGFGDKLKKPKVENTVTPTPTNTSTGTRGIVNTEIHRQDTVEKSAPAIKVGDSVKIVGDAIYSNAHEGVKVPEWVKKQTLTVKQISSDGARALLMPITSWTYVKFIQKV